MESPEYRIAVGAMAMVHTLVWVLVNEKVLDRERLGGMFQELVDDLTPQERHEPRGMILQSMIGELQQKDQPPKPSRPDWLRVIDGGRLQDDEPPR